MKGARSAALVLLLAACALSPPPPRGLAPLEAIVLGNAQDGGLPHVGCARPCCEAARRDPSRRALVASLGLIDRDARRAFLVDATPDFPEQVEALDRAAGRPPSALPDGILLTHAHVGHYSGLIHLGREVAGADHVPVWCTPSMAAFLRANGPWSLLVSEGHVELRETPPSTTVDLTPRLRATPIAVPHRREFSDCVAWRIEGPGRVLLYLPDIDAWDDLPGGLPGILRGVDVALLDGTFSDPAAELPGRDASKVPHPPIPDTLRRLAALRARPEVWFIHLNHTNPANRPGSTESRGVEAGGARVARAGERLPLGRGRE
ncbi:MAG TPA: MBL fold metallo-hydrolase [Planctomycetota bacterium]|nr:MBL fold metallo-hydrolase [Planctomycetota bacterium]